MDGIRESTKSLACPVSVCPATANNTVTSIVHGSLPNSEHSYAEAKFFALVRPEVTLLFLPFVFI